MKVTQIFGLVLLFHLVAISLILLQPGCQTRQPPPPPEGVSTARSTQLERSAPTPARGDYVPPSRTSEPNRTAAGRPITASDTPSGSSRTLDPAFNAGLTSGPGGNQEILQPTVGFDDFDLPKNEAPSSSGSTRTYTVVAGDNLSRIAREYGVTVNALKSANNLSTNTIRVGQELTIPSPSAPTQTSTVDAAGETYTVRSGDTLSGIASRHGVTVTDLKRQNSLTSDTIRVGQTLYVPESRARSVSSSTGSSANSSNVSNTGSGNTYTVQPGDTPGGIAQRYGVDHRELMRINNIASANRMQVGQQLIIPAGGSQPAASSPSNREATSVQRSGEPAPRTATPATTTQQSRSTSLNPQPSQPARIGQEPSATATPRNELDLLENSEIPLMDVEVIDESDDDAN